MANPLRSKECPRLQDRTNGPKRLGRQAPDDENLKSRGSIRRKIRTQALQDKGSQSGFKIEDAKKTKAELQAVQRVGGVAKVLVNPDRATAGTRVSLKVEVMSKAHCAGSPDDSFIAEENENELQSITSPVGSTPVALSTQSVLNSALSPASISLAAPSLLSSANPIPSFIPSSNPALKPPPNAIAISIANPTAIASPSAIRSVAITTTTTTTTTATTNASTNQPGQGLEGTERLGLPNAVKGSPGRCRRDQIPAKHFEIDMNKHGLLDKIVHIQKLNDYFEIELGSNRKGSDSMQGTGEQAPGNCAFENTLKTDMTKGFTFPFQKRARSQSPLRNAPLFGQNDADSPNSRKPVLVTGNFVLGRDLRAMDNFGQKESVEEFNTLLESEDCLDMAGLSTGPTDEERHARQAKGMTIAETENDWMYQRLEHASVPNGSASTLQDPLIQQLLSKVNTGP